MSGPIRKLIGPTKKRLFDYFKDVEKFVATPINEEAIEDEEATIEEYIERINNNVCLIEKCNREWATLLREVKGDKKVAEEEEQARAADGPEGYAEALIAAGEVIARLKGRLKRVKRRVELKELHEQKEKLYHSSLVDTHSNLSSPTQSVVKVNLPKIQLPNFEGNVQEWTGFWDMFRTSVHEQTISKVCKFNYLKSVLKGAAAAAISGIALSDENYDLAVALLKERFGREEVIVESLYAKLQSLPKASNKFTEVHRTYQTIEKVLRQLESQGEAINQQRVLIQLVLSKFPSEILVKLEESKQPTRRWIMEELRAAISQYIRVQENVYRYSGTRGQFTTQSSSNRGQFSTQVHNSKGCLSGQRPPDFEERGHQSQASADVFTSISGKKSQWSMRPCIFCTGGHYNDECNKYVSLIDRKKKLTKEGRCFVCLRTGHFSKNCPNLRKRCCDHCGKQGKHNRCLCPEKFPEMVSSKDNNSEAFCVSDSVTVDTLTSASVGNVEEVRSKKPIVQISESLLASGDKVLLQTAMVPIQGSEGKLVNARVLLDSGSQRTFITTKLAQQLKLQMIDKEHLSVFTFGVDKARDIETHVVNFKMKIKDGSYMLLSANVLKRITGFIHRNPLLQKDVEFLRLIPQNQLADSIPNTTETTSVDILIGADFFWNLIGNDKVVLPSGMFMLQSKLGYIVTGRCSGTDCSTSAPHTLFVSVDIDRCISEPTAGSPEMCFSTNSPVEKPSLERLWSLETIGIRDPLTPNNDDETLHKFCEGIKYSEGRYHIVWPWKQQQFQLDDNYELAFRRLISLVNRLQQDPELMQKYNGIINQQLQKGIVEKVDNFTVSGVRSHYLPHHPILTPSKATTKVRIVYDASAKAQRSSSSLNECLHRGPIILPDLIGLLLRFRLHWIVILADVERAFLQIGIQEADRDVTRFLWLRHVDRSVDNDNVCVYRFCRVPFGLTCSPFLLGATLKYHLQQEGTPLALNIMNNIYVDNVLVGAESSKQAYMIYQEAKAMFKKASMNLRE